MKKVLTAFLLIGFICLLGLVLTKMTYEPVDSLIRPPKIEGENAEIQTAFENSVESGYLFKSPLAGEYRSSFIRKDIDSDSTDEVIVFYAKTDAVDVIRINVLDKKDGQWESIADIESTYNDIYQINFADVDNDSFTEIIVCLRNFENELLNTLNVYNVTDTKSGINIKSVFSKNYSEFLICDVNSDDKTDILIFDKISSNGTNEIKASFYDFNNDEAVLTAEINLDPAISSIGSVCYDCGFDYLRVYIDGYKTDTGITTDIIYWDEYETDFGYVENDYYASIATVATRSKNIYSADINGDTIIEIPVEDYIPYSEVYSEDSQEVKEQSMIVWMQHDGYNLVEVQYEIFNSAYDYSLKISADQLGDFTVTNDLRNGLLTFYAYDNGNPPKENKKPEKQEGNRKNPEKYSDQAQKPEKEELFSIFVASDRDYELNESDDFRLIATDNGFNYYYRIQQTGKDNGITKDMIKSMLST